VRTGLRGDATADEHGESASIFELEGAGRGECSARPPLAEREKRVFVPVWDAAPDKHAAERAQKPSSSRRNFSPWRAPMALPLLRAVDLQVHALALQVTPGAVLVAVPRHGWPGSWSKWRPGRELASGSNRE
jgi:hypothetical protein